MKEKLYKNDFKFIIPNIAKTSELIDLNEIINDSFKLKSKYNIYNYNKISGFYDVLSKVEPDFKELLKINSEGIYVNYLNELTRLRDLIWPLLEQKENFYKALSVHFLNCKAKYENITTQRFSFSLKNNNMFSPANVTLSDIIRNALILGDYFKRFLNLSRHRVIHDKICGYFWTWMRMPNGMPYLHVNFYMKRGFNAKLPCDIINLWLKCSLYRGEVIYFSIGSDFGNSEVYHGKVKTIQSRSLSGNRTDSFDGAYCDYNYSVMSNMHSYYKFASTPNDIKKFHQYLDIVSREHYALNLIPSDRFPVFVSSKKSKPKIIRSYGFSQLK
ncbi:hypothetical protein [Yersinia bercovieri]|uniref:hypothetical protein n=1 Tax=Yersinia bercovieri TaxID=634 RepID=UPI001CFD49BD|nr:hypothetical protein [Yersinia bercovieri]MCB5302962.1 hypothetical protein [Yersinia bercovieri]